MAHVIDVDRGVTLRQIVAFDKKNPAKFLPDPTYGGLSVYMYKDEPGIYYDPHGNQVPEGIAKIAGFDTNKLARARKKKEALASFEKEMSRQLALEDEGEIEILAEKGDWQVIAMPMDRAKIVDKTSGEMVTAVPLPRLDAMNLLDLLVDASAEAAQPSTTKGK